MKRSILLLLLVTPAALAVEFEDFDYSRWSQDVTECDRLAAHPRDPGRITEGVSSAEMDKEAAIKACAAAVKADPENPRLNYQLARAYAYLGRGEEAMPYREQPLTVDYPQSTFVIGYVHLLGLNIEQNTCRALTLWQRSARYQRLAALISLPRHYLRGDFAECGIEISNDELRAYLEQAKVVSSDYYVTMLADELLARLD